MKNTKTKTWIKLGLAILLSNVFFFLLFSGDSEVKQESSSAPSGWVEVQLEAQLLTPFQSGKKVLLIQRNAGKKLEGVLKGHELADAGKLTVLVKEDEAEALFRFSTWEVLPYLRHLSLTEVKKGYSHEIRY